jgi:bifunctional DNA-binding transcriptional regulator/antitoxin component of YhaV-PrlF toxin-antitoxin module
MSGMYQVRMGDRGRLVVPAELRLSAGFVEGTPLILVETGGGVVVVTREQLKTLVRADLAEKDLVGDLLAERRRQSAEEDAA